MIYDVQNSELHWQKEWAKAKIFESEIDLSKPKFYCLEMFPYPSGNMHMGHVRNYSIGDSMARFQRLMGKNVLYPMGYDSFGMPAENAAKKENGHPHNVTHRNIASIRKDQERMGYSYDWNRFLATSDVNYYRWNQEIFLMFNERGLVERRSAPVNWCNECDTVLANEQVKNNRCWRCGLEVIQKDMSQWFLKMSDYSDELLDELDNITFPENVKTMQRNWIGRSYGAHIDFRICDHESKIRVFTTRPDTIFGATFVTLSPEHPLCEELCKNTEWELDWRKLKEECLKMSEFERINMLKEKKGVFLGKYAINPLSKEEVPIYAGNFVVSSYGTGAVMAVPGHDQRDYDFAKKYNLPIRRVLIVKQNDDPEEPLTSAFEGYGPMVNSPIDGFDGFSGEEAKNAVIESLKKEKLGEGTTQYRLKDWLLSRQRFWGTPIPMIHCDSCGVIPVPKESLPVELPLDVVFTENQSGNPLDQHSDFVNVTCPECGKMARRETDTMDTFYDSSWYFMRYCDSNNEISPFDKEITDYWMEGGIDLYIGGIEHAVMHLLYARFFTKILRDEELISTGEPFGRLVCQGMLNSPTPFCSRCNIDYHVDYFDKSCPTCNDKLNSRSSKMSKSLGNTVSPGDMIEIYGADTVRLFILFGANPEAGMDWSDSVLEANNRQMNSIIEAINNGLNMKNIESKMDNWLLAKLRKNQTLWINSMSNVGIREGVMLSHFSMLSDWSWYCRRGGNNHQIAKSFIKGWLPMLSPVTPHVAEEFWHRLNEDGFLSSYIMPEITEHDTDSYILAQEEYLRGVIDSARNVKGLAQRHSDQKITTLTLQTSPEWKKTLAKEVIKLEKEDFNFKKEGINYLKTLSIFAKDELSAELFQTWNNLTMGSKKKRGRVFTWSDNDKKLIISSLNESEFLRSNEEFLLKELDLQSIFIYAVGEGEDVAGKAKVAFPLDPGISFT